MTHILLINLPSDNNKKPYDKAFHFSKNINFGLLSIATYIKDNGLIVSIFDPYSKDYGDIKSAIISEITETNPSIIGLSCISGFSYPSLKEVSAYIKNLFPKISIITGGKDHVGLISEEVLLQCPAVDIVIRGEAELTTLYVVNSIMGEYQLSDIPNIAYRELNGNIKITSSTDTTNLSTIPSLDYTLYPNYLSFPPSIEVSRGCPYSCKFCVNNRSAVRKKPIADIIKDIKLIIKLYQTQNPALYFETPMFSFSNQEIEELIDIKNREGLKFTWRTETRVEYLSSHRIDRLAEAGLKVVDLGLESGSPEILLRMNKTPNPSDYLDSAALVLRTAYENDIIVKINILFYIGENYNTVHETIMFLERYNKYIQSISAYPLIAHPDMINNPEIQTELDKFGGSYNQSQEWSDRHLMAINSSSELSYDDLEKIGILIGKSYQSVDTFYLQKRYGYFSPTVSYPEFRDAAERFGIDKLPFFSEDEEARMAKYELMRILKKLN